MFDNTADVTHSDGMHDEPTGPITGAHRLSPGQERKLVDYLEEHLLNITRNYKKRSHPSSTLPSLASYLAAVHPLLVLILQIPPAEPSASLRTSLLLRLTGEVLGSITGYRPDIDTLPQLLQWLDELDRGWLAVLRGQAWNPASHSGIDIGVSGQTAGLGNGSDAAGRGSPRPSTSQTDRTRLRSILIGGTNQMEEWLADIDSVDENFQAALETMDMQRGFNDIFAQTLGEMGSLDGSMPIDSQRMAETC